MKQKYIAGDIFMVDGQPRKITWIGSSYPRVEIDGVDVACKSSDLKPIPLTPEIFKKNGWKKEHGNYIDEDHHLMLDGKYEGYALYKVINEKVIWLMDISYVHQLQHLLFGLGLDSNMIV